MTLFNGDTLLVSLPGAEVERMSLSSSLVDPPVVLANTLSSELRVALEVLGGEAQRRGLPIKYIARPEVFTSGLSHVWLMQRISKSAQHICLSDGSTVKHLPGFDTSVFFYSLSLHRSRAALNKLAYRAPELLIHIKSQINTHLVLCQKPFPVRPEPVLVPRTTPLQDPSFTLLSFFLNRDSAEDSANRIERAGQIAVEDVAGFREMIYLPVTEAALNDAAFRRLAIELLVKAYFDCSSLVVLRLPAGLQAGHLLRHGLAILLDAVRKTGLSLPRATPPNILLATQDMPEDHAFLDYFPLQIVLHETFDFWRYTISFYERATKVMVFMKSAGATEAGSLRVDIRDIYGRNAVRRWLTQEAQHD